MHADQGIKDGIIEILHGKGGQDGGIAKQDGREGIDLQTTVFGTLWAAGPPVVAAEDYFFCLDTVKNQAVCMDQEVSLKKIEDLIDLPADQVVFWRLGYWNRLRVSLRIKGKGIEIELWRSYVQSSLQVSTLRKQKRDEMFRLSLEKELIPIKSQLDVFQCEMILIEPDVTG